MSSFTPNIHLLLTPENDKTTTFKEWRTGINGEGGNSNMAKIDEKIGDIDSILNDMTDEHLAPPATVIIGCIDSKHWRVVDYCYPASSVNDDEMFQAAINALPPHGGKIVILEGGYTISGKLTCNKDVIFEGMGDSTVINCTNHSFLYNSSSSCQIIIRNMKFNLTGMLSGEYPFIKTNCDLTISGCCICANTSGMSPASDLGRTAYADYIFCDRNAFITNTRFEIEPSFTDASNLCSAVIHDQNEDFAVNINNCYLKVSNLTNNSGGTYNLYIMRSGVLKNSRILIGGSGYIAEYGTNTDGCYIKLEDGEDGGSGICSWMGENSTACFTNNEVLYTGGLTIPYGVVSNNKFKGTGRLRFTSSRFSIVTGNVFVNNAVNTVNGVANLIFKNNVLKYQCDVSADSSAKISDNIICSNIE